jgi:hypothetical protein
MDLQLVKKLPVSRISGGIYRAGPCHWRHKFRLLLLATTSRGDRLVGASLRTPAIAQRAPLQELTKVQISPGYIFSCDMPPLRRATL